MPKWSDRVWQEFRAGNLTRAYRDVLLTLGLVEDTPENHSQAG
jgi:hypothetical protein